MVFRKLVLDSFRTLQRGALEVALPNGETRHFGGLAKGLRARIEITDEAFFRRCVLYGPIGFAESYMAGEWDSPDLTKVIAWFILNAEDASGMKTRSGRSGGALDLLSAFNRLLHLRRPNSVRTSRANIRDHYDLSNDFFKLWLDPTMTYSSAWFDPPDLSLEEAQRKKYDMLCQRLRLAPTDEVLEIGSGWGGFSMHAAQNYGCRVTTLTISEEQYAEAAVRIHAAGLQDRIDLQLRDYRHIEGRFDKIASIEMLEAVGDRYVDGFFGRCSELLKPHGLLGLQAILCPDQQYAILRDGVDFIQKHIFPGSLLMSNGRIAQAMQATGHFNLLDYADMASFYARTLRIWRDNFLAKLPEVRALGFDSVFVRKWLYYLCYCEAAFGTRHISVAQMVYTRPDNVGLKSPAYDIFGD
jgi:cyclopropane-fatty-acyl-phospholipid synthase